MYSPVAMPVVVMKKPSLTAVHCVELEPSHAIQSAWSQTEMREK